jgi:bacterioferritin
MNNKIIKTLNSLLQAELIGIRQYLLNGIRLRFDGHVKLAKKFLEEAHENGEVSHAEILAKRILMLGGEIECPGIETCKTGKTLSDILNASLALEKKAVMDYEAAVKQSGEEGDFATADILTEILREEEEHKRWLEMNLELMKKMGEQNYIQFISQDCE